MNQIEKDEKRLRDIDDLLERYYASEDSFEQTELAIELIQGNMNFLITMATSDIENRKRLKKFLGVDTGGTP